MLLALSVESWKLAAYRTHRWAPPGAAVPADSTPLTPGYRPGYDRFGAVTAGAHAPFGTYRCVRSQQRTPGTAHWFGPTQSLD